ncbi:MAG: hypothetical protein HY912_11185 [Desulfomonile tiedjei]|uniref:Uncharacterized protein n=1 Tax=Desulfomonile tiedjei TaxID=2358 RepID=A0A9D6Z0K8_9BACT|nr:hypothetical protein [Desulfomonile tiedjei]
MTLRAIRWMGVVKWRNETVRPEFSSAIMIDDQGAKISSDTGFLLLREID